MNQVYSTRTLLVSAAVPWARPLRLCCLPRLCHQSGGRYSLYRGSKSPIPVRSTWASLWTLWQRDRLSPSTSAFHCRPSFHYRSMLTLIDLELTPYVDFCWHVNTKATTKDIQWMKKFGLGDALWRVRLFSAVLKHSVLTSFCLDSRQD